jgi:hypothetical protein
MRRPYWIVPALAATALATYLLARPAAAPADPDHPTAANQQTPVAPGKYPHTPPAGEAPKEPQGTAPIPAPKFPQPAGTASGPALPITQVVLYSSGLGYFQREGVVDGDARVDLAFPTQDVNDLLKSMVLQDLGGGHVSAVNFDSHDPLDKTLNSFAIQLTNNPTYAQILGQARGEYVEVSVATGRTVQGKIVGIETRQPVVKDGASVEVLNLWCADGMRGVALAEVQSVKFLNPAVEAEVQRALEVLSGCHDTQKKGVSLQFSGTGSRKVRVGYVVETPLWRTSYRMLIGKDGKPFVQGWAVVQNPTNEDWKDVRMALVSGRPIAFKMDLYQPLYAFRPLVQPVIPGMIAPGRVYNNGQYTNPGIPVNNPPPFITSSTVTTAVNGIPTTFQGPQYPATQLAAPAPQGGTAVDIGNGVIAYPNQAPDGVNLQRGVVADTTASDSGDSFQYAIEHTVNVPRQKSALLPIVNKALEGERISLYNCQTHAKHPLLTLRLKNTSGVHLMQGPVTVFEGNGYAGDAQLPDLRPGEERLVSYALDLGTEVTPTPGAQVIQLVSLQLHKGILASTTTTRDAVTYVVRNRGPQDRVVLVEHADRGFRLVSKEQPCQHAGGVYRFEVKVAAGKTAKLEVVEEQVLVTNLALANFNPETTRYYTECECANAKVKPALEKMLQIQEKLAADRQQLTTLQQNASNLLHDQERLRQLLKDTPDKADAYKRYLAKYDAQEVTFEKIGKQFEELKAQVERDLKAFETFVNGLDLETKVHKAPMERVVPPVNETPSLPVMPIHAPPANPPVNPPPLCPAPTSFYRG